MEKSESFSNLLLPELWGEELRQDDAVPEDPAVEQKDESSLKVSEHAVELLPISTGTALEKVKNVLNAGKRKRKQPKKDEPKPKKVKKEDTVRAYYGSVTDKVNVTLLMLVTG